MTLLEAELNAALKANKDLKFRSALKGQAEEGLWSLLLGRFRAIFTN
jgi:hypothetical protein